MYFGSAFLTIFSLLSFATCNYILNETEIKLKNEIKWATLFCACLLVFAVQMGVQTIPQILSGELFPSDVRPRCKGISRCIQCIFAVSCLKVSLSNQYKIIIG